MNDSIKPGVYTPTDTSEPIPPVIQLEKEVIPLMKIIPDSSEEQCADTPIIPDTTFYPTVQTPARPQRARQTAIHLKEYVNK